MLTNDQSASLTQDHDGAGNAKGRDAGGVDRHQNVAIATRFQTLVEMQM